MFSINETPVILRMVNDHPYGNVRFASHFSLIIRKSIGRIIPRRRRLPLCHFVTSPQRGAPLPYNMILLLRTKRNYEARVRYVINAVPYGEVDLLRIEMAFIGKVSAGASPRPTISFICFAFVRR